MSLCLSKKCLFWEGGQCTAGLAWGHNEGCHYSIWFWHCSASLGAICRNEGQGNAVCCSAGLLAGLQRSAGAEQGGQALCAPPNHHGSGAGTSFAYVQITALHELNQVCEKNVPIPLAESIHVIGYLGQGGNGLFVVGWEPNN